jgi:hypothetical protein
VLGLKEIGKSLLAGGLFNVLVFGVQPVIELAPIPARTPAKVDRLWRIASINKFKKLRLRKADVRGGSVGIKGTRWVGERVL